MREDYFAIASWVPDEIACLRWAGPRVTFPFSVTDLPTLLEIPADISASYCLANGDDNVYGFGQYWVLNPGAVHLGRIIVSPHVRGQGIGAELCKRLISTALDHTGARVVTLRVYQDNFVALQLYKRMGFMEVTEESKDDVLFMQKDANGS